MPNNPQPEPIKRVVVYLSASSHQRLKVLLAMEGKTVSQWFREQAQELDDRYLERED